MSGSISAMAGPKRFVWLILAPGFAQDGVDGVASNLQILSGQRSLDQSISKSHYVRFLDVLRGECGRLGAPTCWHGLGELTGS